jgi:hypothetical protein
MPSLAFIVTLSVAMLSAVMLKVVAPSFRILRSLAYFVKSFDLKFSKGLFYFVSPSCAYPVNILRS